MSQLQPPLPAPTFTLATGRGHRSLPNPFASDAGTTFHNRLAVIGGLIIFSLLVIAAIGPWIAPYDPLEMVLVDQFLPPSQRALDGDR